MDSHAWELFDPAIAPVGEDLRPFLREALSRAARWFSADAASAFLAESPGQFVLTAQVGGLPLPEGTVLKQGVAQAAIDARAPLLVGDPADHPSLRERRYARRADIASAMVLPLILPDGEAVGVINISRRAGGDPYNDADLLRARAMAGHLALSIGLAQRTVANARMAREEARTRHLAEVGRMTAILAHEIRNPLAAIKAATQIAADAPEYLEVVLEEVDRLDMLCEGFLDYSRPLSVRPQPTELPGLLRRLAEREAPLFEKDGVSLTVQAEATEPVPLDPLRIEQACRNLLQNAREAVGRGGNVQLRAWKNGFEVTDDGPGLTAELRESLFTPFVTAKPRGTGLGLTVVRRVAEAHGGRVLVGEGAGKGAAFRVELGVGR